LGYLILRRPILPFYYFLAILSEVLHNRNTRCSDIIVTLQRPSVWSTLKLTDRSFTHHALDLPSTFVNRRLINPASIKPAPLWIYLRLSFIRNSNRLSSTDHSLLGMCALPLMSVFWFLNPAMFFFSYPFSMLSFTVTSFIASVNISGIALASLFHLIHISLSFTVDPEIDRVDRCLLESSQWIGQKATMTMDGLVYQV